MVQRTYFTVRLSTLYNNVKNEDKTGKVAISEISWKRERDRIYFKWLLKKLSRGKTIIPVI